ncbi:hypothetical protein HMPREF0833_11831 [Streptococcus parasanguinis ATCC 15912]|uniref:Uncharacterized protein n=1 Tax=Streptococcus parasanguinis (strain ATCC 15912 / DSM 6778 / CIP 104372 / LMG 14537) TaxID=760570 RepID=F8DHU1_STREP|nr:hypothetical protein HMPREF0833_11831 [Streptococcus parasanguinis ATCC 15912]
MRRIFIKEEKKISTTDPESGWFHKGEHKIFLKIQKNKRQK